MRLECPKCGWGKDVPEHYAGRTLGCPRCRTKFVAGESKPVEEDPVSLEPVLTSAADDDGTTRQKTKKASPPRSLVAKMSLDLTSFPFKPATRSVAAVSTFSNALDP